MAVTTRAVMVNDDGELVAPVVETFKNANGLNGTVWTGLQVLRSDEAWPSSLTAFYLRVPLPPMLGVEGGSLAVKHVRLIATNELVTPDGTTAAKLRYLDSTAGNSGTTYDFDPETGLINYHLPSETTDYDPDFTQFITAASAPDVRMLLSLQHTGSTPPKGAYLEIEWQTWAA